MDELLERYYIVATELTRLRQVDSLLPRLSIGAGEVGPVHKKIRDWQDRLEKELEEVGDAIRADGPHP